jgi:ribosomal protein S12 methylthiotransferase accessory factor
MNESPSAPPLFDPFTGLVTSLTEIELGRCDPRLFVVAARVARTDTLGFRTSAVLGGSAAGLTIQRAYAATIGECAERYASCVLHPEDLIHGSYDELQRLGHSPVAPERWALFADHQYDALPFRPYRRDTTIAWARAESLTRAQDCLVPASLVYLCESDMFGEGEQTIGPAVSTGAACAGSRPVALLRGLCEVIERDAFIIMWRNRLAVPRLRIDSRSAIHGLFNDAFVRPGLEFKLFYTTLDLSVPSFFGMLTDTRGQSPRTIVGGAAHFDPCEAAIRTLTELVQGLKWMESFEGRTFAVEPGFAGVRTFDDRVMLYASNDLPEAFSFLLDGNDEIELSSITSLETANSRADLRRLYGLLADRDLEAIALDLTPVDVAACGLHVIKALVPGCEPIEGDHRAPFLGGRRWQEVPVRLGLRRAPTALEAINPWPHPYP